MQSILWKVAATLSGTAAALAARKAATAMWEKGKGGEPPTNPADPNTNWGEAIGWTLLIGVLAAGSRLLARRGAAEAWRKLDGAYPPGLEDVTA